MAGSWAIFYDEGNYVIIIDELLIMSWQKPKIKSS